MMCSGAFGRRSCRGMDVLFFLCRVHVFLTHKVSVLPLIFMNDSMITEFISFSLYKRVRFQNKNAVKYNNILQCSFLLSFSLSKCSELTLEPVCGRIRRAWVQTPVAQGYLTIKGWFHSLSLSLSGLLSLDSLLCLGFSSSSKQTHLSLQPSQNKVPLLPMYYLNMSR